MAQLSDFLKNPTVRTTAIGIGIAVLVPIVAAKLAPFVRPLARSVFKLGTVTYEKGRETIAEYGEIVEDMVAEVREELHAEQQEPDFALEESIATADDPAVTSRIEPSKAESD